MSATSLPSASSRSGLGELTDHLLRGVSSPRRHREQPFLPNAWAGRLSLDPDNQQGPRHADTTKTSAVLPWKGEGKPCGGGTSRAVRSASSAGRGRSDGVSGIFWLLLWCYFLVAFLVVLFRIIGDLFRDRELGGGMKAVWFIGLLVVPILSVVIYLFTRGDGMANRQMRAARQVEGGTDRYMQRAAGGGRNSADEIWLGEASARRRHDQSGRVRASQGQGAGMIVGAT